MEYGKWLIDRAVEMCEPPTRYELAKRLGVSESNLNSVYQGRRKLPASWVGPIAVLAGIEPGEAVLRVLAERAGAKKPPTLGAWGAVGGAGMLLISYGISVGHHPKLLAVMTACFDCLRIVSTKRTFRLIDCRTCHQGAVTA